MKKTYTMDCKLLATKENKYGVRLTIYTMDSEEEAKKMSEMILEMIQEQLESGSLEMLDQKWRPILDS